MLPEVNLNPVTREDVDRIAGWLSDTEVSSRWFGHYACGDPVHRGYEPSIMLESSDSMWEQVFLLDQNRLIFSIYSEETGHIGECQLLCDGKGGGELSLLIGRRDVWHKGYGTSAMLELLELTFESRRLEKAWVQVSPDNKPALGLFRKLGFKSSKKTASCSVSGTFDPLILEMQAASFNFCSSDLDTETWIPTVTVSGLTGSGSENIAKKLAEISGARLVGTDEINKLISERLKCSTGEISDLEHSHRSRFSRWVREVADNWEFSGGMVEAVDWVYADKYWMPDNHPYVNREQYRNSAKAVIGEIVRDYPSVLHGPGLNAVLPNNLPSVKILVSAPVAWREHIVSRDESIPLNMAAKVIQKRDKETSFRANSLFCSDIDNHFEFDLIINNDRFSIDQLRQALKLASPPSIDFENRLAKQPN